MGANKIPYLVTHDGRTLRYPRPDIKKYDTVKVLFIKLYLLITLYSLILRLVKSKVSSSSKMPYQLLSLVVITSVELVLSNQLRSIQVASTLLTLEMLVDTSFPPVLPTCSPLVRARSQSFHYCQERVLRWTQLKKETKDTAKKVLNE